MPVGERNAIVFDDLQCTVYLDHVPEWVTAELPTLYESSFAVEEYFRIFDGVTSFNACVLTEPRHVVCFTHAGPTGTVLNQLFDFDGSAADVVCGAVFRALPSVRRIRFNGSRLDPVQMALPTRVVAHSEDTVVDLPETYEAYVAGLGPSTRKNLRWYSNRFAKTFPDHLTVAVERGQIAPQTVRAIIDLNRRRMTAKGEQSSISDEEQDRVIELARHYGMCVTILVGGSIVAGTLGSLIGRDYYGHVQGFDPGYAKYRPGWLCLTRTLEQGSARGVRRFHMLWGRASYKTDLGGEPQPLCAFVVYRSDLWRLAHIDDAVSATRMRIGRSGLASSARQGRSRMGRLLHAPRKPDV